MIINYLPVGKGDSFPPIPDETHFTYSLYTDIDGITKAYITNCDFLNYSGSSITIPESIAGYHVGRYASNMLKTNLMGNVKTIYFTNIDYNFYFTGSGYTNHTLFPSPIEKVYMALFNINFLNYEGSAKSICIASNNNTLTVFQANNNKTISRYSGNATNELGEFYNAPIDYFVFPNANSAGPYSFTNSSIKDTNLSNFKKIERFAFSNCVALTGEVNCKNVVSIYNGAFSGSVNIKSIHFDSLVSCSESYLFRSCTSLEDIYLPKLTGIAFGETTGINPVQFSWFRYCDNLKHIYVSEENYQVIYDYLASLPYAKYGSDLKELVTIYTPTE